MTKKTTTEAVHWNLNDVFPDGKFDTLYTEIEAEMPKYAEWQKKLAPDMSEADFQAYFAWSFALSEKLTLLYSRPSLAESTDAKSEEAKRDKPRAQDLAVRLREVSRPISMWLKGKEVAGMQTLDDANAKRLFACIEGMEYALTYARDMARHTLAQAEESIISHKDATGTSALTDLRDMIETDFTFELELDGKTEQFETAEELKSGVYSTDAARRKATYQALFAPYIREEDKFFKVYQSIVKDWAYEAG